MARLARVAIAVACAGVFVLGATESSAQNAPATAPVATAATTTAPAVADPGALLRAANVPQADRDEAARRVIARQTADSDKLIGAALADASNRAAQLSAARAIPLDTDPDQSFVGSLFSLIGPQPSLTDAAIQALASYRNQPDVANRLIALAIDPQRQQRETTRASAIKAIGTMPNKRSAGVLMDIVTGDMEPPAVRNAAASALADMTGIVTNRNDTAQWMRWWNVNQPKDDGVFERELLEARSGRLVRLQNRVDRGSVEQRLLLEELYQTAPEKNKEAVLTRYLRSSEPDVRTLGATLVQSDFRATRAIPPTVRDQLRAMVGDSSSQVRIAVAQALFLLNDAQAFDALLTQLAREPDADARMELARALVPMRDVRVVEPLLKLLNDPSTAVAAEAARGLASDNLAPLIQKDPNLATRAAVALRQALNQRAVGPGTATFRAAIVDAMGALKNENLREDYQRLLRANEPVPVRRAALRALGQFGKPNGQIWPADIILQDGLQDSDETVRQEAVRALKTTADFSHANRLYELIGKETREPSQAVRDEAWGVLRNLFADPTATNSQLMTFADRFKGDPEKRIEVLKVVAERLTPLNDARSQGELASVRSNLGAEYMELARRAAGRTDLDAAAKDQAVVENAKQADLFFDLALKYYRAKDPRDEGMTTSDLIERRMGALLTSKQYPAAADFAAGSITANAGNQEAMGRSIRGELERLRTANQYDDALRLIDAVKKMNPPLAEPILIAIQNIENDIRKRVESQPPATPAPQSAAAAGNGAVVTSSSSASTKRPTPSA